MVLTGKELQHRKPRGNFISRIAACLFLLLVSIGNHPSAQAIILEYAYTGNTFTDVNPPFTALDSIRGYFTIDCDLASTISGGLQDCEFLGGGDYRFAVTDYYFEVSSPSLPPGTYSVSITDPSILIERIYFTNFGSDPIYPSGWDIIFAKVLADGSILEIDLWGSPFDPFDRVILSNPVRSSKSDTRGLWAVSPVPPSPIPVPPAIWLFGTALAVFAGMSRRRKLS